ncbi:hypothetical protein B0H19DRAFT_1241150 [Mycena capillaripes]|nr:hypothetical protein B0H19DRAFT_1241150 [Mycena capillaripes]
MGQPCPSVSFLSGNFDLIYLIPERDFCLKSRRLHSIEVQSYCQERKRSVPTIFPRSTPNLLESLLEPETIGYGRPADKHASWAKDKAELYLVAAKAKDPRQLSRLHGGTLGQPSCKVEGMYELLETRGGTRVTTLVVPGPHTYICNPMTRFGSAGASYIAQIYVPDRGSPFCGAYRAHTADPMYSTPDLTLPCTIEVIWRVAAVCASAGLKRRAQYKVRRGVSDRSSDDPYSTHPPRASIAASSGGGIPVCAASLRATSVNATPRTSINAGDASSRRHASAQRVPPPQKPSAREQPAQPMHHDLHSPHTAVARMECHGEVLGSPRPMSALIGVPDVLACGPGVEAAPGSPRSAARSPTTHFGGALRAQRVFAASPPSLQRSIRCQCGAGVRGE